MTNVTRTLFISRCFIGIAVALFATSSLAQTPPFVPEASTGKQILSTATNPDLIFVQANAVVVDIQADIDFHPDLNAFSVNAVLAPSSFLAPMAPAGMSPAGPIFTGTFSVDASSVGTIDILSTAAYNGDPRRARGMVSVDVVQEPIVPTTCPPICVFPDPDPFDDFRIIVDYFPGVGQALANQIAADVDTSLPEAGLSVFSFEVLTNSYTYEVEIDAAADPNLAQQILDEVLTAFRVQVDFVESAIRDPGVAEE